MSNSFFIKIALDVLWHRWHVENNEAMKEW